ncbi:hypothetical protein H7X46_00020 [Pseudonocardia sp. C8]|uniref:hypothetical protein n=1 Tax=Pseudonocardia sp. C8 TaxID=2762759 RepID=UPI001642C61C|nr:hypothetical protein [Pseudonocardia sp. C8]MBC3189457.1 hypothetical protein [Pseudonocardia sp. C8]
MNSTSVTRRVSVDPETGFWTLDGAIPTQLSISEQRLLEDLLVDLYGPTEISDNEPGDNEPPF